MTRPQVVVREADVRDEPAIRLMLGQLVSQMSPPVRNPCAPSVESIERRLADLTDISADPSDSGARLLVATIDDEVVGVASASCEPLTPLQNLRTLRVSYLYVLAPYRRRGVGRALIWTVLGWAETVGADHVVVDVDPTSRDANRFFARLGLAPLLVQRYAAVPSLRRRLASSAPGGPEEAVGRMASPRLRSRRVAGVSGRALRARTARPA